MVPGGREGDVRGGVGEWSCREGDVRSTPTEAKVTLEAS